MHSGRWLMACVAVTGSGLGTLAAAAAPAHEPTPLTVPAAAAKPATAALDEKLAFLPQVVARYGGKELTAVQVKKMAAPHLVNLLANGQDLPETELRQRVCRVVDYLIDRDLLLGLAQKDGFAPNREDGLTQLAEIEERFGGAEKFDAMLKWQGLSRDDVIEQVSSEQALARWMEAKVKPGVVVDDEAVKAFYAQNQERFTTPEKMQTSHILITVAKAATAGEKKVARQKADSLLSRVRAGDEFEGLARENSGCPSAGKGGDLGFFGKGEMVPAFEQVAFGLEPGQLSDVVATDFGFHILKGGQRQPATAKSFEEIKTSLRQRLEQEAVLNAVRGIVGKQREEAKVEVLLKEE